MGSSDVVYVEKRRGPRTEPWGTPVSSWCSVDTSPPQATLKDQPLRQDSNQRSGIPVMPSDERVVRRIWWLTVSKAADRSSRMRTDDLVSAFEIRRASMTESSAVSVECPHLNPDWLTSSRLCFDRKEDNWLKTTRSMFSLWMEGERDRSVAICKRSV